MPTWGDITGFCLGLRRSRDIDAPTGTTGFDMETLAPSREATRAERLVAAVATVLTLLAAALTLLSPSWRALTDGTRAWAYGGAGLLWALRMLSPPRIPVDRESIGLGLYTFLPWLPSALSRLNRLHPDLSRYGLSEADLEWLGRHALVFMTLTVIGVALDIRSEMRRR